MVFSSFIIKLIAIITMTLDHVGYILIGSFQEFQACMVIGEIFRLFGRLAFPLYVFMVVEGVIHTRNFKRYILSLGIMATAIFIAQIVMEYGLKMAGFRDGNIFIDLIMIALAVKFISLKNNYLKLLTLLPVGYCVFAFVVSSYQFAGYKEAANILPFYLRPQYFFYGVVMGLLIYLSYKAVKIYYYFTRQTFENYDSFVGTKEHRFATNLFIGLSIVIATLGLYVLGLITNSSFVFWDYSLQNYAMISGALLLLYNGKRGYNAVWFKYGCYLYYPLHMLVIYGIANLIYLVI